MVVVGVIEGRRRRVSLVHVLEALAQEVLGNQDIYLCEKGPVNDEQSVRACELPVLP